ncbi:MAG: LytTR family DNA-binding domain-containing protein [Arcicella sp.]|jgi:DNA-binding LytR/AlgR family response regulator|nr:LytTR family DNA-binding domain-containing protein [Arcicella sp.]
MKTIRCIVLEDEEPAQNLMRNYFNRIPELELVEVFDNAIDASDFLAENTIDLIFTDIEMPRLSGLDFIRMLSYKPHVIIITAYPNFALEGFELDAIDYLKKPVSFDRFKKAVEKVQRMYINNSVEESPAEMAMYVKESGKMMKIEFRDILYVEGLKDYVKIIVSNSDRPIVTHITMKRMEDTLPNQQFSRVHKSYIIATDRIVSVDSGNSLVELRNKVEIPLGQNYKELLMSKIKPIN